jgi:acyl carrier protein
MNAPWDERFERILRHHLRFLPASDALDPDSRLGDLGLDSLASVQVLLTLEEAYAVSIPDDRLNAEMFETAASLWQAVMWECRPAR